MCLLWREGLLSRAFKLRLRASCEEGDAERCCGKCQGHGVSHRSRRKKHNALKRGFRLSFFVFSLSERAIINTIGAKGAMRSWSRAVPEGGGRGGGATARTQSSSSSLVLVRLVPLLLLFVAAAVLPAPTRPAVMTDFFASRELGRGVQCGYSENTATEKNGGGSSSGDGDDSGSTAAACSRAHSSAAAAASLSDFFGNSLALLVAPALGRASDVVVVVVASSHGGGGAPGTLPAPPRRRSLRSRYLSLAMLSSALPPLTLALHQSLLAAPAPAPPAPSPSPPAPSPLLYLYFLFSSLATAAPGAAICLAYAADALPAGGRAPAFAAVSAAVSAGLLLGAGGGAFMGAQRAAWLATAGVAVSAMLAAWLPEAQGGGGAKAKSSSRGSSSGSSSSSSSSPPPPPSSLSSPPPPSSLSPSSTNPLPAFGLLTSTPQARRLLACVVLSAAAAAGLSDTIAQFLQQRLSFGAGDQALLLAVAGAGGVVAQAVVLPLLLRSGAVAGEAGLLRVGLAAALLEHALLVGVDTPSLESPELRPIALGTRFFVL